MLHFLVGKLKVEDVDIFLYALLVRGFRDNHNTPLHIETEDDLCRGLTVLSGDGNEHRGAQQLDKAVFAERLVDKHKVEIVCLQLAHGLHDRCTRLFVTVLRHPYFGSDEQFLAVDAAPVDGKSLLEMQSRSQSSTHSTVSRDGLPVNSEEMETAFCPS